MPAYIKKLYPLDCKTCKQPNAKYQVFNTYNAYMGTFCKSCAEKEVKRLNENG